MPKKKKKDGAPETHEDLKGLDFYIDEFGQLHSSIPLKKINEFLDKNVVDKKLVEKWEKEGKLPKGTAEKAADNDKAETSGDDDQDG